MKGPIVITGGGTGGHIFPMRAIGEELLARGVEPAMIRYVGSRRGQEASLLSDGPISLTLLPGRGFQRSGSVRATLINLWSAVRLVWASVEATTRIALWRPSVVVSFGGYASFATSLAAVLCRRRLVLVDFDATPGIAHRLLARYASQRCTAFPDDDVRSTFTGAPLRQSITDVDRSPASRQRARAEASPPISDGRLIIVVMTGSLGSHRVNSAVSHLAGLWRERSDVTIVHVSGRRDFDEVCSNAPPSGELDYRIVAFGDMAKLWGYCDLAICRAGAITIAELTALGIPSILVPLPGAPGDHQTKNAESLVAVGAARMLPDDQCEPSRLASLIDEVGQAPTLAAMSRAAFSRGQRDATAKIVDVIAMVEAGP